MTKCVKPLSDLATVSTRSKSFRSTNHNSPFGRTQSRLVAKWLDAVCHTGPYAVEPGAGRRQRAWVNHLRRGRVRQHGQRGQGRAVGPGTSQNSKGAQMAVANSPIIDGFTWRIWFIYIGFHIGFHVADLTVYQLDCSNLSSVDRHLCPPGKLRSMPATSCDFIHLSMRRGSNLR